MLHLALLYCIELTYYKLQHHTQQVHNWASDFTNPNDPHLEFVSVGKTYAVIDGVKTEIDLSKVLTCTELFFPD